MFGVLDIYIHNKCIYSILPQNPDNAAIETLLSGSKITCLFLMVNTVIIDVLATQVAEALSAMALPAMAKSSLNIPGTAPRRLRYIMILKVVQET